MQSPFRIAPTTTPDVSGMVQRGADACGAAGRWRGGPWWPGSPKHEGRPGPERGPPNAPRRPSPGDPAAAGIPKALEPPPPPGPLPAPGCARPRAVRRRIGGTARLCLGALAVAVADITRGTQPGPPTRRYARPALFGAKVPPAKPRRLSTVRARMLQTCKIWSFRTGRSDGWWRSSGRLCPCKNPCCATARER